VSAGRAVESLEEAYRENRERLASSARPDLSRRESIWPYVCRERRHSKMLATKVMTTKEHVNGHYEVTHTPWATDYLWMPGEEEVEGRLLDEVLHPWQAAYAEWVKEERTHPEEQLWMEMEAL
jgi:hypothetical protein